MYRFPASGFRFRYVSLSLIILLYLLAGCGDEDPVGSTPYDATAPGPVTSLRTIARDEKSVTLTWRAPGDDEGGTGSAESYDFRYATDDLTPEVWNRATLAVVDSPAEAGSPDTTTVTGLDRGVTYYFGLKTVDENHNWSAISNVISTTTDFGGPYTRLLEGVPARSPKWSPDGRHIAFSSGQNIWTLPVAGGDPVRITTEGGFHPCWSPDGDEIAFVSTRTGRTELWRIPSSGGSETQITNEPSIIYFEHPDWSPDGELIAFDAYDGFYRDIYVVSLEGGEPEAFTDEKGIDNLPVWSPDGCRLAFRSSRPNLQTPWAIWIGCRDGSSLEKVTGSEWTRTPAWSPGADRLLFMQYHEVQFERAQLWWMPATGGSWVQITREDRGSFKEPDWSPDGTRIVCAHQGLGSSVLELWTIGVE